MAIEFKLPDIGEGVAEGEIVKWLVQVGDQVKEHQPIVEVMTDKATVEIPSPADGTITETLPSEGDVVPVGDVLFRLDAQAASEAGRGRGRARGLRAPGRGTGGSRPGARAPAAVDSSSSCPTSAKGWPRARSSSGWSKPDKRSRSTRPWSRS